MPRQKTPKKCWHCGKEGLFFNKVPPSDAVRLTDDFAGSILHVCNKEQRRNFQADKPTELVGEVPPVKTEPVFSKPTPETQVTKSELSAKLEQIAKDAANANKSEKSEEKADLPGSASGASGEDNSESESDSDSDSQEQPDYVSWPQVEDGKLYSAIQPAVKADIAKDVLAVAGMLADEMQIISTANKDIQAKYASFAAKLEELRKAAQLEIVIKLPNGEEKHVNGAHPEFAKLLRYLSASQNALLVGPAGSGKTYAAEMCAEALNLMFYPQSVGPQTSKSDLIGYMSASGGYVPTVLYKAYTEGGLYLLDEIDAGNAGVLTVLNALLANNVCSFPCGVVRKHKDFRCIAAANTFGNGASRLYVGRTQLDAATLDRFVGINWNYDRNLETRLSVGFEKWRDYVWAMREKAESLEMRVIFGTRRIQQGVALLSAGASWEDTQAATVHFGLSVDDKDKLESRRPIQPVSPARKF